ncbi:ABC transporter permease [Bradyrhizobium sp. ISRA464]|uniref:ABC transporter permease n=1 Tax=Bradyrhizobium sp. ISRA464 TaxID=2866200 RepID=UPI00247AB73C|nr:ABC transporter permease [Bradyrhizobium sp. ISRA464]WGS31100.1 ABC transporter permease [Bradyrhizobium sp. ISRA464]
MDRGLFWLAVVDLRRAWLRSLATALAIALALVAITFFAAQIGLRRAELLTSYEESGATTLIVDLNKVPMGEIADLIRALRSAAGVQSIVAPYNGTQLGLVADTSFVVFENEKQQESLGARTTALGVDRSFDPVRDYYVNFHDLNPNASTATLGAPLLATSGTARPPDRNEVVVPSGVADYVGIRPGAEATVDLTYVNADPPIVRRYEKLRLIGTFDLVGPDQGRFEPFWRLAARGSEVLTVRRPDAPKGVATTLPILLNDQVLKDFFGFVGEQLAARGMPPPKETAAKELIVRAHSVREVPTVEGEAISLLDERNLKQDCGATGESTFCLRVPERNNFEAALQEQGKLEAGGSFFIFLLLVLVAAGVAGLQIQLILARWRELGILQAVGFSPFKVLLYFAIRMYTVLAAGMVIAAVAVIILPFVRSASTFGFATGVALVATTIAALPVLLWPLAQAPAQLLRVSA